MKFIVEVKKVESVKVGERYEDSIPMRDVYSPNDRRVTNIMEDQVRVVLRQEVDNLNLPELVKLLNGIV